jgi:hypothetical protein
MQPAIAKAFLQSAALRSVSKILLTANFKFYYKGKSLQIIKQIQQAEKITYSEIERLMLR